MTESDVEAREALYKKIAALADRTTSSEGVLRLAEAWAWLSSPGQPHGGHVTNK